MQRTSAILSMILLVSSVLAEDYHDYYEDGSCDHDHFYCDYDAPSTFYRCIDGVFHTFHCPAGLHFSTKTQNCDWPHLADCNGMGHADSGGGHSESAPSHDSSGGHSSGLSAPVAQHNHGHSGGGENWGHIGGNSWISKAAAAGKSWWRPTDVNAKQWKDVSSLKKPAFQPHVPDDKKEGEDSKPKKSGGKPKKKSGSSPTSSKSTASKSAASKSTASKKGTKKAGQTAHVPKPKGGQTSHVTSHTSPKRGRSDSIQQKGGECNSGGCQLPNCFCAGSSIPNGLPAKSTPQMVMLTFDDEVSPAFYGFYQRLFRPGRYNPNGCPVRGCLFVSGSGTKYDLVHPLYALGNEIASHSVSHRFPHTWWSSASYQDYMEEAGGMKDNLVSQSGIPREAIKGFRVPFLQLGSDAMYSALYDSKFTYDSSMFTGAQWEGKNNPVWPFTLDYLPGPTYCQHGPCPTKEYPGMWEIPVQRWYGLDGHSCAMPDGCGATADAHETLEYLKSNFRRYYNTNRAPFGIFVHARWFQTEHNLEGLDSFIDYLLTLDDVYIVTPSQVIEWMRKPTPLSGLNGFGPWACSGASKDATLSARK